jgi:uncharacterized protein DUF695
MNIAQRVCESLFRLATGTALALAVTAPLAIAAEHKPLAVWVIGEGEKNGHPISVRWRDKMPDAEFRKRHPWCVEITWRFQRDANGNVTKEETERALDFDTALEQELENPETAMQAAGFSDNEHRVWIYYATDRYKIQAALDTLKRNDASLPVSYETHQDAEWQGLALVLGTVKQ